MPGHQLLFSLSCTVTCLPRTSGVMVAERGRLVEVLMGAGLGDAVRVCVGAGVAVKTGGGLVKVGDMVGVSVAGRGVRIR